MKISCIYFIVFYILCKFICKNLLPKQSGDKSVFFAILLYPEYLEDPEDTYHDESVFVSVMRTHEVCDLPTEIYNQDEEEEYTHHQSLPIGCSPVRECWVICLEILGLEYSESAYNEYE